MTHIPRKLFFACYRESMKTASLLLFIFAPQLSRPAFRQCTLSIPLTPTVKTAPPPLVPNIIPPMHTLYPSYRTPPRAQRARGGVSVSFSCCPLLGKVARPCAPKGVSSYRPLPHPAAHSPSLIPSPSRGRVYLRRISMHKPQNPRSGRAKAAARRKISFPRPRAIPP